MNVKIIVDSTTDLRPEIRDKVSIVPLTVHFGQEEYIDGVTIDSRTFYEKLVESDVLPTTSQASPYAFSRVFEEALSDGSQIVCITVASRLSGTYQSAVIAAQEYPGRVFVVDSQSVAIGTAILTEYALELKDKGLDAETIAWKVMGKREQVRVLAMLDTLEYLKKGGRITSAAAIAGGILNIKPVVTLTGGEIKVLGKARGSRQGNNLLVQEIRKAGGVDFSRPLMLGYTGLSDTLLHKYIRDSAALWEGNREDLPYTVIGSVIGTHAGPGAVAVAFFAAGEP